MIITCYNKLNYIARINVCRVWERHGKDQIIFKHKKVTIFLRHEKGECVKSIENFESVDLSEMTGLIMTELGITN